MLDIRFSSEMNAQSALWQVALAKLGYRIGWEATLELRMNKDKARVWFRRGIPTAIPCCRIGEGPVRVDPSQAMVLHGASWTGRAVGDDGD